MSIEEENPIDDRSLSILNEHRRILPGPNLLHELVPTAASEAAETVAIDHLAADQTRTTITYAQLSKYVRSIASRLSTFTSHNGVSDIIPVMIPQCPALYVTYLAILYAGAGFCPVATDVPTERLKFIIKDVAAKTIVTTREHARMVQEAAPEVSCLVVELSEVWLNQEVPTPLAGERSRKSSISSTETAYVMYTSGSTGLPKAVQVSHQSVTQSLLAHDEHIPTFKRFLQFASPTFDVSVFEIFFPFFRKATLVCCEREQMLGDLPGILRKLNVDAAELTPSVAQTLLRYRSAAPCLKILLTIGEMLTRHVIDEFGGSSSQESMLYAMYGPTEASIHCTLAPGLSIGSSVKNIGIPLSTVTAFVISEPSQGSKTHVLPVGEIGELAIAGQLASGYLNRPEQTSDAFIHLVDHDHVYRTGDKAYITAAGNLHILGRISVGQIKLRGQRVELGEIEEVACKTPGVELAVAVVVEEALVLFCIGNPSLSESEIYLTCKLWLPRFMRPTKILLLQSIPRLASGKIDRRTLEEQYKHELQRNVSQPGHYNTDLVHRVVEEIGRALNADIKAGTSLSSCGLDSLRAIKIAASLRSTFPQITALMLLDSDTVYDLSTKLAKASQGNGHCIHQPMYRDSQQWQELRTSILDSLTAKRLHDSVVDVLPCNAMQIAMLTETIADRKINFNTIELDLDPNVTFVEFKAALSQVAKQNEILRTGFSETESLQMPFVQIIWRDLTLGEELDLLYPLHLIAEPNSDNIVVQLHHALYDGWSWDLVMNDVNSFLLDRSIEYRPQLRDFSDYQELSASHSLQENQKHWAECLEKLQTTPFPGLHSTNLGTRNLHTCKHSINIKPERLSSSAAKVGVSCETFMQAAMSILLASYCDNSEVTFGVVSSGRERAFIGIDRVIGPCLSLYPIRIDLALVPTCSDLLLYIHRQHIENVRHGSLTLAQIKECANLSPAHSIFDVLCVWQETLQSTSNQTKVHTKDTYDSTNCGIVLEAEPRDQTIEVKLTFDNTNITSEQAELLLLQLDHVWSKILSDGELEIGEVWSSLESKLSSIYNENYQPFEEAFHLTTCIENLAFKDPGRCAVEFVESFDPTTGNRQTQTLTYYELYQNSTFLARALVGTFHVQPNDRICILLEKSVGLYITILSTIMSGAGYMCIDHRTPYERVIQILEEAQCKIIIVDKKNLKSYQPIASTTVLSYDDLQHTTALAVTLPENISGDRVAYTVFTSGTTGKPKGMQVSRRNLLSNIHQLSKIYPCQQTEDKLLQACSPAFDVSVFEIFWTWHMGMTLCSAQNDVLFRDIEKLIDNLSITHLSMTPSVAALVEATNVPKVKVLVTAGEPMNSTVFKSWSGRGLYQGYGPSETTNICNVRYCSASNEPMNNVGPALPNTSVFICRKGVNKEGTDRDLSLKDFMILPKGVLGEIWIGGDQVCQGYVNQQQTDQSFLEHPRYGRLYRSGDIGRLLADGSLFIHGREDTQVKIRGQRVELGDINSTLVNNRCIQDAVTLVIKSASVIKLVSFCIWRTCLDRSLKQEQQSESIFSWLHNHLPSYSIPDTVVPVDQIHLTRQGKVDRQSMINLYNSLDEHEKAAFSHGFEAVDSGNEMSAMEYAIANALSDITKVSLKSISTRTSFFSVGIDSISGVHFSRALKQLGFINADVSLILKHSSIKRLLHYLEDSTSVADSVTENTNNYMFDSEWHAEILERYKLQGYAVSHILPCTPLQQAMISMSDNGSNTAYLNILKFKIKTDTNSLRQAWLTLVKRHELLRTAFVETQDPEWSYAQVVLREFDLPWVEIADRDVPILPTLSTNLPPYHIWIIHGGRYEDPTMQLTMHHCLYDADAMSILLHEAEQILRGESLPWPIPFSRYLNYMTSLDIHKIDFFWQGLLTGIQPTRLYPVVSKLQRDLPETDTSFEPFVAHKSLRELESFAKAQNLTLLSILQASLARLLSCYTHSSDVCFGNIASGRNLDVDGVDRIVGPCFNTLPLYVSMNKRIANKDLARKLQQDNIDMLRFQPTSLRRLQKHYSPDGRPLFDVLLLLQQEKVDIDRSVWEMVEEAGEMSFPFIIEVTPMKSCNELHLRLHTQSCGRQTAEQMLNNLRILLEHTLSYPEAPALNFGIIQNSIPDIDSVLDSIESRCADRELGRTEDPSWSETESIVKDVILQLSRVSIADINPLTTIFMLGLDSINAVQVASKLRGIGYQISTADVLEASSIGKIAKVCENQIICPETPAMVDLPLFDSSYRKDVLSQVMVPSEDVESVLPCTPTQCGILSQFISSHGTLYYNRIRLSLGSIINAEKLEGAWNMMMDRHSILRTGFVQLDDMTYPFVMIVYKSRALKLPWKVVTPMNSQIQPDDTLNCLHRSPWQINFFQQEQENFLDIWMLHSLYDARSLQILLKDLFNTYHDGTMVLPKPWTTMLAKSLYKSQDEGKAKTFWLEASRDMQVTLFPDLKVYQERNKRLFTKMLQLSATETEVRQRCSKLNVTFQSVCQAVWAKLLAAYAGTSKVAFGITLSGRTTDDDSRIVFPCLNTAPFVTRVGKDTTQYLSRVHKQNINIARYQFTPFSKIKKWGGISEHLFDTILVLQDFNSESEEFKPWRIIEDEGSAEYAVSLEIIPDCRDNINLQLTYRIDVLPQSQAEIILQQFDAMISCELRLIKTDDTPKLECLRSVVQPKEDRIPTDIQFLHEFVERMSIQQPNSVALEFATSKHFDNIEIQEWTYSELDSWGNRFANLLIQKGVCTGDLVAICFDKCPEASFVILGILKAGCAYVAIDPSAPKARKDFILSDAKCKIVLTTSDKAAEFEKAAISVVIADDPSTLSGIESHKPSLQGQLTGENTCYCLYTSGTTGTPKGCLISHASVVQAMISFQRIFTGRWNEDSRWLQFASFHFDVSVLEQYWSWSVGIRMTSAPRDMLFEDLPGTLNKLHITHLDLTPSLAKLITPEEVPSLCTGVFIVGGEQVRQEVLDIWGDTGCLYNFYGPSEVTIGCTVHPQVRKNAKPTNIGQQWDNVGTFVLDPESEEPVLRGAVGELCLSGPLVGKGYLNRPDLTAKKFVTLQHYKTRVYRTGDLVRLLHNNSFEFLGRIDDQVKLRGQRLEIGEINHVLSSCDTDIRDASTLVLKHPLQKKEQLVAFFSTSKSKKASSSDIRLKKGKRSRQLSKDLEAFCKDRLPAYMIPTSFICIEFIPLNANNKTDNKALQAWYEINFDQAMSDNNYTSAAATELPENYDKVVKIIAEYLKVDSQNIFPESKIFELGFDSITVVGLSQTIKRKGFPNADIHKIMKSSNIESLARTMQTDSNLQSGVNEVEAASANFRIFANKARKTVTKTLELESAVIEDIVPCTSLQEAMISRTMRSSEGNPPYFNSFSFVLNREVDVARLQAAWDLVANHLAILRTKFVSTEAGYAQVILRKARIQCLHILGSSSKVDVAQTFSEWTSAAIRLDKALPWQVCFSLNTRGDRLMSLFIFHGLYDGVGMTLLLELLKTAYCTQRVHDIHIPQFYNVLQCGPMRIRKQAEVFWRQHLEQPVLLGLQNNRRPFAVEPAVAKVTLSLSGSTSLCSQLNVTLPAIFQAAWLFTLYQIYSTTPTLGIVVSGRSIDVENADRIIGPLFNTIPSFIVNLPSDPKIFDLIKACHTSNVESIPFQHTSLRDIKKWLDMSPTSDLFDSLFVFQKVLQDDSQSNDPLWSALESTSRPDYPLNIEVEQQADRVTFQITIIMECATSMPEISPDSLLTLLTNILQALESNEDSVLPNNFGQTTKDRPLPTKTTKSDFATIDHVKGSEWSETELKIASELAAFAQVRLETIQLSRPTIFELGLDSIDALKLTARLKEIGLSIPVSKIMQYPTVSGLAANALEKTIHSPSKIQAYDTVLKQQQRYLQLLKGQGKESDGVELILPVTAMQEGILLDSQKYSNVLSYAIAEDTNIERLTDSITQTVTQVPMLRSCFVVVDDPQSPESFLQVVEKQSQSKVEHFMPSELQDLDDFVRQMRDSRPNDPITGLPFGFTIVSSKNGSQVLLLSTSHAMYDAWSMHLLHAHISDIYSGISPQLQETAALVFHIDQVQQAASDEGSRKYWTRTLTGCRSTLPQLNTNDGIRYPAILLEKFSRVDLKIILLTCSDIGITLQSLGLACWAAVLASLCDCLDIVHGLVLSGRTTENSENLIYPTFNTVCFRTKLSPDLSISQWLKVVHDEVIKALEYQHFPLKTALKMAGKPQSELFSTLFTYQKLPFTQATAQPLYKEIDLAQNSAEPPFPINIEMTTVDERLKWTIAVQQDVASQSQVAVLFGLLDDVLESIVKSPKSTVLKNVANGYSICGLGHLTVNHNEAQNITLPETQDQPSVQAKREETWTETELNILEVLALVSKMEPAQINKDTGIFHLGLDSVSAIKIAGLLRKRNIRLSVSDIVRAQSISAMALTIQENRQSSHIPRTSKNISHEKQRIQEMLMQYQFPATTIEDILPVTAGQLYMLDAWKASQGRLLYVDFWLAAHNIRNERLQTAIENITKDMPTLRTTFIVYEQKTFAVVMKPEKLKSCPNLLPWSIDLLLDGEQVLIHFKIHHALYDAVSLQIIFNEITTRSRDAITSSLNIDSQPFLENTQPCDELSASTRRRFWTNYLNPTDSESSARHVMSGSFETLQREHFKAEFLSVDLIEAYAKKHGISTQTLFFATYARVHATLLAKSARKSSITIEPEYVNIGVYMSNRSLDIPDLANLASPTLNILPLRIDVRPTTNIAAVAKQIQVDLQQIGSPQYCGTSMRDIYEWTGLRPDAYVNFIRLPNDDSETEEPSTTAGSENEPSIAHIKSQSLTRAQSMFSSTKITKLPPPSPFLLDNLGDNLEPRIPKENTETTPLHGWCIPAINIEARITPTGYLAMGVFAPSDMIDDEEVIFDGVKRILESVIEEDI